MSLSVTQAEVLGCIIKGGIKHLEYRIGEELPTNGREPTSIIVMGKGFGFNVPIEDWRVIRPLLSPGGGIHGVNLLHPTKDAYEALRW